jgi:branched-chain amino acid transport system ATP-binding protein
MNAPVDLAAPSEPILDVRAVSLSFKGVKAISELSFSVIRGEIFALIGPNGAGKSSLLNVLNGVYIPDSGEIVFEGKHFRQIESLEAARRGIARTFQNNALFKKMSVLDNVLTGLARHRISRTSALSRRYRRYPRLRHSETGRTRSRAGLGADTVVTRRTARRHERAGKGRDE